MIKHLLRGIICAILIFSQEIHVLAQWQFDPKTNLNVCNAPGAQSKPVITSDGSGGYFIAWQDQRSGNFDVYVQRYDMNGNIVGGWPANGINVNFSATTGDQTNPSIAYDGGGGAYITFTDAGVTPNQIRLYRINSSGGNQPGFPVTVSNAGPGNVNISKVVTVSGSAFVAWEDNSSQFNVRCQMVANNGTFPAPWNPAPFVISGTYANFLALNDVIVNPSNQVIVAWTHDVTITDNEISSALVTTTRTTPWGGPQFVAQGVGVQQDARILHSSTSGNLIYAYLDNNGTPTVRARSLLSSNGLNYWAAVKVSSLAVTEGNPSICNSNGDGIISFSANNGTNDIYVQKLTGTTGAKPWGIEVNICNATGSQTVPLIISDNSSGAIVSWLDTRSGTSDIFSQRINTSGTPQWTPNGVPICIAPNAQSVPSVITDGSNGAVMVWSDARVAPTDIFMNMVDPDGNLPVFGISPSSSGYAGQPIGLTGTNFAGVGTDSIWFNGSTMGAFTTDCPSPCSNVNNLIVPALAPGSYQLDVFNRTGRNTNPMFFTILSPSISATITTVAPYCSGNNVNVQFNAQGFFAPGNNFTIELSTPSGSFPGTVLQTLTNNTTTGVQNIVVTIPLPTATSSTYRVRVNSSNMSIIGTPSPNYTITQPPAAPITTPSMSVCTGGSINLTAGFIPTATYNWTGPSAFASTLQNPVRSGAVLPYAGTYFVTASISGCTGPSGSTIVTVNSTVVPTVSISQTAGTNPMCPSTSATFTASITNGGPGPVYQWKVNGGNVGINSNTYTTSTLLNGDVVTCQLTSNAICASPAVVTSNTFTANIFSGVTIPDANFVTWLNTNYPACMCGNFMKTSCAAITSATYVDVSSNSISDLTGIQYFTSLTNLTCDHNLLTTVPTLPGSLTDLYCNNNSITSLPVLPSGLTHFDCSFNSQTSLPSLPGNLQYFYCNDNSLTSLPSLPSTVIDLQCYDNPITSLPPLPGSLLNLDCHNNALSGLPILPGSLQYLYCYGNSLTSLPSLPASLLSLDCSTNLLTSLPTLPPNLTGLYCSNNSITTVPALPATLQYLYCNNNSISTLPALPNSLCTLTATGNNAGLCYPTPACPTITADISACVLSIPSISSFAPSPVCENAVVTISGNFFTGTTDIKINGTSVPVANFTVVNDNQINLTVPVGASSGYIDVINASGTGTSPTTLTVNAAPATPSTGNVSICQGGTATLTATGPGIEWYDALTGGSLVATGSPYNFSPGANITLYPQATSAGCASIRSAANVTVFSNPTVTITPPAAVCSPATIDLTDPAIVVGSAGVTSWGYFSDPGCTSPLATPASIGFSGNFYIKGSNAAGCFDVQPISTTVNIPPTDPTVTNASGCPGAPVTLSANHSGGTEWRWWTASTGGTLILNSFSNPNSNKVENVPSTVWVEYFDGNCLSNRVMVQALPLPTPTADISGSQTVCSGGPATLTVNFTGTGPWDIDLYDGTTTTPFTSIGANPFTIVQNPTSTTNYTLTSVTAGCAGTTTGNALITVNAGVTIPDANFAAWLNTNYPGCMCGNVMDISCPAITSTTSIDVSLLGIADLTGIQYFTSLVVLHCEGNLLSTLPPLPSTLNELYASQNTLTGLPALPPNLLRLDCDNCSLPNLPSLPSTLNVLNCRGNSMTALPTLPSSLVAVNCGQNNLNSLPALPSSLQMLDCSLNNIPSIPVLPSTLQVLICGDNLLTGLPALPASMTNLDCSNNTIATLPTLPISLCTLIGAGNPGLCYPTPACPTISADIPACVLSVPSISSFSPNPTCIGSVVNISGSFFTGTTDVKINGTSVPIANFTVVNDNQINLTIPVGATSGLIDVTNGSGTGTSASSLTVNTIPVVNAGTDLTITSTSVNLNGNSPAVGTGTWTLYSGGGSIATPTSPTSSVTALPLGANQFIWSINDGVCPIQKDTVTITVFSNMSSCAASTPVFAVDLSSNPVGVWTSPNVVRNGLCCSYGGANTCINFLVTLEPTANGIILDIASGPVPGGALPDEADCGVPSTLASPVCFTGPAIHSVTFCKPGNNTNTYRVTSIKVDPAGPITGPSIVCANQNNVVYSIATVNGATTYNWTVPSGATIVAGAGTTSITVNFGATAGNVCVTATNGCPGGAPSCMAVSVNPSVLIPDANFAAWLNTNYPTCMCGNLMNTGCAAITSATSVDVNSLGISDLTGIEYFTSLQTLICATNNLTSLPPLPSGLTDLLCDVNSITSLPSLPASLTYLECSNNLITTLPSLPSGLSVLKCSGNGHTSLPVLPSTLTVLICANNSISSLPTLPSGLIDLQCDNNGLTSLPSLPSSLNTLSCIMNSITSLPTLPSGLTVLDCSTNSIAVIPALPISLCNLSATGNPATCYPTPACPTITADIPPCALSIPSISTLNPNPICEGNAVTITGSFFTGTSDIKINGTSVPVANFTVVNDNQINLTVPIGATSGLVDITNGSGTGTSPTSLTVQVKPTASAGSNQFVCANNATVNLVGSRTGSTGSTWTGGGGSFGNASLTSTIYTPTAAEISGGSVILTITTTVNGVCPAGVGSMTVNFTPAPTANAGSGQTKCANNAFTTLNGFVTIASGGHWTGGSGTFGNAFATTTTYTPSNADTTAGSVMLTLTSTGNGTCAAVTGNITITFTHAPVVNAGPNQSICANNSIVNLNGTEVVATGGTWTGGSGSFGNANALITTYTPTAAEIAGGGPITLTLTSTGNGTCSAVNKSMTIAFTSAPTSSAGPDQLVCTSVPSVSLNGNVTIASGGSWSTSGSGGFTPNNTTLIANYNPSAADKLGGLVYLILTTTGNGTCNPDVDSMQVTFSSGANTSVPVSLGDTVCPGANGVITIGSEMGIDYQTESGGIPFGPIVSGNGGPINILIPDVSLAFGSNRLSIRATLAGCPFARLLDSTTLDRSSISASSISPGFGNILCNGAPIDLSVPNSAFNTYQWFLNDTTSVVGATTNTYSVVKAGRYSLDVKDTLLCVLRTASVKVDPPLTNVSVSTLGTVLSTAASSGYYQWYVITPSGNRAIYGANSSSYQVYYNADYFVAINSNNCRLVAPSVTFSNGAFTALARKNFAMNDSTIFIVTPTYEEGEVVIFPNPTDGAFTVDYKASTTEPVVIELFDAHGVRILSRTYASHSGIVADIFSNLGLRAGIYHLSVTEGDKIIMKNIQIN